MKSKIYLIIIIIIILIFIFIVKYNKKQNLINEIIKEWKKKVSLKVFKDDDEYKNDYYLMIGNNNDYSTHVHLITHNSINFFYHNFLHIFDLSYVIKNEFNHSKEYVINENESSKKIVSEIIQNIIKFDNKIKINK